MGTPAALRYGGMGDGTSGRSDNIENHKQVKAPDALNDKMVKIYKANRIDKW